MKRADFSKVFFFIFQLIWSIDKFNLNNRYIKSYCCGSLDLSIKTTKRLFVKCFFFLVYFSNLLKLKTRFKSEHIKTIVFFLNSAFEMNLMFSRLKYLIWSRIKTLKRSIVKFFVIARKKTQFSSRIAWGWMKHWTEAYTQKCMHKVNSSPKEELLLHKSNLSILQYGSF